MALKEYGAKITRRYRRDVSKWCSRRMVRMRNTHPMISFTFDDFPRSAMVNGGATLKDAGARGTYYASLGLAGKVAPTGQIFLNEDLPALIRGGHELGCHTFAHCHAYDTPASLFEGSVTENALALQKILPGLKFKTLSYPISGPNRETKRLAGERFACCRGGGQTYNSGTIDLNLVSAFFLEQSHGNISSIERLVKGTYAENGWLIFATHDVTENPTPFGCEISFFRRVVEVAVRSGVQILTVSEAFEAIHAHEN